MSTTEETLVTTDGGLFDQTLRRSNKQIRDDRAQSISEDAQLTYERQIQDMEMNWKKLGRKRNNMLDLSPTNADSLMLGEDFDSKGFCDKDVSIGVEMRNLEIKLSIAYGRYKQLFGKEFPATIKF